MGQKAITGVRTRSVLGGLAAIAIVAATASGAAALTLPTLSPTTSSSTTSTTHSNSSKSAAGQPTPQNTLLCGTYMQGTDRISGASNIDHPAGATAAGSQYTYTGSNNCESPGSSTGMFNWTLTHSNVNLVSERGTEHGEFMLSQSNREAGFDGHITDFDLNGGDPIPCGDGRQVYYASGHAYDTACAVPSGPGNFNTHGGAQTGQHFRGNYGTLVYQDTNNTSSQCQSGSTTYCFEAILKGQTN